MHCVQTLDSFCFQPVLSNGDGNVKNDTGKSTNQLSRTYVGVIWYTNIDCSWGEWYNSNMVDSFASLAIVFDSNIQ